MAPNTAMWLSTTRLRSSSSGSSVQTPRREFARRIEFSEDDVATEEHEVTHQVLEIDRRLDADLRRANRVLRSKRMLPRPEYLPADREAGVQVRPRGVRRLLCRRFVDQRVVVEPRHAEMRPGEELELAIRDVRGAAVLRIPLRRAPIVFNEARRRRKAGERHVRGDVRRHRQRIDGDVEAAALQLTRAGEPDRTAADDRCPPRLMLGGE